MLRGLMAGVLAGWLACAGAARAADAPDAIKVGTLYASSGPFASISMPMYNALKLWSERVNAEGGAFVKAFDRKIPIRLVAYDDQSSTATAATLYNHLITQDKVDLLVADSGSVLTSIAVPTAREHKMLLFNQNGTGVNFFSADNPYMALVTAPIASLWPKYLAEFLLAQAPELGIRKLAILYATNDFTGSQAAMLKAALDGKSGIEVVYYNGVPTNTSNYTVLLRNIAEIRPDALIELGYPGNDIAFFHNLQDSGLKFRMIFGIFPGIERELLAKNVGPKGLENVFSYVTSADISYRPNFGMTLEAFRDAYHAKYGKDAELGFDSVAGYTTGLVLQKTLEAADSLDQLDLRKAVFSLSGKLRTLDGAFELREDGAQLGELSPVGQLRDGAHMTVVYPPDVATGKPDIPAR